jgi:small subunit ribosomal protein S8
MSDYISNIIIKLKNANWANKPNAVFPYSNYGLSIAEALSKNGFVGGVSKKGKKTKMVEVGLLYEDGTPKISGVKRLSKLSKRSYLGYKDIKSVKRGYGKMIISTPKGILSGEEARKQKVGGEPLFEIW